MKQKLGSRKLWAAIVWAVITLIEQLANTSLTTQEIGAQAAPFLAYIFGESFADAFRRQNGPPKP